MKINDKSFFCEYIHNQEENGIIEKPRLEYPSGSPRRPPTGQGGLSLYIFPFKKISSLSCK